MPYTTVPHLQIGQFGARDKINSLIDNADDLNARVIALTTAIAAESQARASAIATEAQARVNADTAEADARADADAMLMPIAAAAVFWRPASRLAHDIAADIDGPYTRPPPAAVVTTDRGEALRVAGAARLAALRPVDHACPTIGRLVARRALPHHYEPAPAVAMFCEWSSGSGGTQIVTLDERTIGDSWIEMTTALDPPADAIGMRFGVMGNVALDVLALDIVATGLGYDATITAMQLGVVTRAALGDPSPPGRVRFVLDAPGGAALAVSDGSFWRIAALGDAI